QYRRLQFSPSRHRTRGLYPAGPVNRQKLALAAIDLRRPAHQPGEPRCATRQGGRQRRCGEQHRRTAYRAGVLVMPQRQLSLFDFAEAIALAKTWRETREGAERNDENAFVIWAREHSDPSAATRALDEKHHYGWHTQLKAEAAEHRVRN